MPNMDSGIDQKHPSRISTSLTLGYLFFTFFGSWPLAAKISAWEIRSRQLSSFEGASGYAAVGGTVIHGLTLILVLWSGLILLRRCPAVVLALTIGFFIASLETFEFLLFLL